jgi:hypothetical protein
MPVTPVVLILICVLTSIDADDTRLLHDVSIGVHFD